MPILTNALRPRAIGLCFTVSCIPGGVRRPKGATEGSIFLKALQPKQASPRYRFTFASETAGQTVAGPFEGCALSWPMPFVVTF